VPIERIEVRVQTGSALMAASDDPLFLRLLGPLGREFRLLLARGKSLRRASSDVFVLGPPGDAGTNVAQPELNDPTRPPIELAGIDGVQLVKGLDPLPNVRGIGELDDRLLLESAAVVLYGADGQTARYRREGPIWLGLVCGLTVGLARVDGEDGAP